MRRENGEMCVESEDYSVVRRLTVKSFFCGELIHVLLYIVLHIDLKPLGIDILGC